MKPILFNTEMVKAILNGRKTMTRRVIKFPKGTTGRLPSNGFFNASPYLFYPGGIKHPRYKVGDVLYVRETWARVSDWTTVDEEVGVPDGYIYKADWDYRENPKWHPSIHMPKEAARIFLKVTNVRVERLQDISFLDALNEGISPQITEYSGRLDHSEIAEAYSISCQKACIDAFHKLWDSTIKKSELDRYGWNANPWVFVYQFDRCEKPVGEVKE
jgi:hypothetical protein